LWYAWNLLLLRTFRLTEQTTTLCKWIIAAIPQISNNSQGASDDIKHAFDYVKGILRHITPST
jgi:hypothetical protein